MIEQYKTEAAFVYPRAVFVAFAVGLGRLKISRFNGLKYAK